MFLYFIIDSDFVTYFSTSMQRLLFTCCETMLLSIHVTKTFTLANQAGHATHGLPFLVVDTKKRPFQFQHLVVEDNHPLLPERIVIRPVKPLDVQCISKPTHPGLGIERLRERLCRHLLIIPRRMPTTLAGPRVWRYRGTARRRRVETPIARALGMPRTRAGDGSLDCRVAHATSPARRGIGTRRGRWRFL